MVVQFLNAVLVVAESSKLGEVEVVVFTFYWGDGPWNLEAGLSNALLSGRFGI